MTPSSFPTPIETRRLLLRAPQTGDGVLVNAAIRESFTDLHQWMPWAHVLPSEAETEAHCREAAEKFAAGAGFPLFGFLKESGAFVLATDLFVHDWAVPKFEIGYWCRTLAQGRGFVTEAVRALTRVGFETFKANAFRFAVMRAMNAAAASPSARATGWKRPCAMSASRRMGPCARR